jgi:tRNA pseudouridine38-40 synthase
MRLYSHFTYVPLDLERMQEAAKYFVGEHDFAAVSTYKPEVESTVRTIYELSVTKEDDLITMRVTGNGFLYNMVRIIAGTLMEVGRGRMEPSDVPAVLASRDREKAGPTAPACGLTLVRYEFEN